VTDTCKPQLKEGVGIYDPGQEEYFDVDIVDRRVLEEEKILFSERY
jgi:hypothetical protein